MAFFRSSSHFPPLYLSLYLWSVPFYVEQNVCHRNPLYFPELDTIFLQYVTNSHFGRNCKLIPNYSMCVWLFRRSLVLFNFLLGYCHAMPCHAYRFYCCCVIVEIFFSFSSSSTFSMTITVFFCLQNQHSVCLIFVSWTRFYCVCHTNIHTHAISFCWTDLQFTINFSYIIIIMAESCFRSFVRNVVLHYRLFGVFCFIRRDFFLVGLNTILSNILKSEFMVEADIVGSFFSKNN